MRCVTTEMGRILKSSRFWLAVFGLTAVSFFSLANEIKAFPDMSVYYFYTVYFFYPMWMLFMIFAVIPGATTFCTDWNHQVFRFEIIRCGKKRYIVSRVLSCIVSAFLVVALAQILLLLVLSIGHPVFLTEDGSGLINGIYEKYLDSDHIWIYFFSIIFQQSLGASFFAMFALWVSVKIPDILVVVTTPIIAYYIIENMTIWLGFPVFLSIPKMLKGIIEIKKGVVYTWLYAAIFWGILILVFSLLFYRDCKRRIENG